MDGKASGLEQSLDEELEIPRVVTPGASRSKDSSKTPSSQPLLHIPPQVKYLVARVKCDEYKLSIMHI